MGSCANLTQIHMKGCASGLALIDTLIGSYPGQGPTEISKEYILCSYNLKEVALTEMCRLCNV